MRTTEAQQFKVDWIHGVDRREGNRRGHFLVLDSAFGSRIAALMARPSRFEDAGAEYDSLLWAFRNHYWHCFLENWQEAGSKFWKVVPHPATPETPKNVLKLEDLKLQAKA